MGFIDNEIRTVKWEKAIRAAAEQDTEAKRRYVQAKLDAAQAETDFISNLKAMLSPDQKAQLGVTFERFCERTLIAQALADELINSNVGEKRAAWDRYGHAFQAWARSHELAIDLARRRQILSQGFGGQHIN